MAKSFQAIMAEARKEVPEITPQQVNDLMANNGKSHVLLDVRESDEWRQGHLEGALPLPRSFWKSKSKLPFPIRKLRSLPIAPVAYALCWRRRP